MSISFPREVANLAPRYGNLMHMYMQHDSVLCIQIMIRKLVCLSFYDPQCGLCHPHCTPTRTPLFPPINDEQPANVRSGVALVSNLSCSLTVSLRLQKPETSSTLLTVLPIVVDCWEGHSDPPGAQLHFGV